MQARNSLQKLKDKLLKPLWERLRPAPSVQTDDDRVTEISQRWASEIKGVDIFRLFDLIDKLRALPESEFESKREQYEDFMFLAQYHLRFLSGMGHALNQQMYEETEEDKYDHLRFPRDWFMDHVHIVPKHRVGDIVWLHTTLHDVAQPEQEVVITSVIVDICGVLYMVAPYSNSELCESFHATYTEDQITTHKESPDSKRKRFDVVR